MRLATCHPDRPHHAKGLCHSCSTAHWREANPEGVNENRRRRYRADPVKNKRWEKANPEKVRADARRYYRNSPEKVRAAIRRRKYGITSEEVNSLLLKQSFQCPICKSPIDESSNVDHCHRTGAIRGILCSSCNSVLGFSKDSLDTLRRAAEYLERSILNNHCPLIEGN